MPTHPSPRPRKPAHPAPTRPTPRQQKPSAPAPTRPTARRQPQKPAPGQPAAPQKPAPTRPAAPRPKPRQPLPGPGLSHFPNRTNWAQRAAGAQRSALTALTAVAAVAAVVRAAGRWGLAAATGEVGRRVGRAAALIVTLAVVVVVLYNRGEVPTAAARPALAAPAARPAAGPGATRRTDHGDRGGLRGRARPAAVGERPAEVAAAWYAARTGVPTAKVKPLQQDRLSAGEVRVLVLADHGHGRLRTALVRLRLGPDGWSVR
jgi:hypothetical protein